VQCVGLDQDAIEIKRAEQLLERCLLTRLVGVIGRLGQRHPKGSGVDGDLSNEPVVAVFCLDGGASQGFAVTDQLVQTLGTTWDLADHPGLQHLAEFLQVGLVEQVEKGGVRRPALEVQAQGLVENFTVPLLLRRSLRLGEGLQIAGAPAAAQDPQHRDQQQEPLRVTHPTPVAAIGNGLEEADQIIRCGLIDCGGKGFGHWGL